MIEIDGSYGEGGGQILRTAIALSAITSKDVRIINIRSGRDKPGLRRQHLTGIKSVMEISNADVKGLYIGSKEILFRPSKILGGNYRFDIKTAGSTTLLLQTVLPVLIFAKTKSTVEMIGGTHVPKSPSYEEVRNVLFPMLKNMGVEAELSIHRYGFYPRGGGVITLSIFPKHNSFLKSIELIEEKEMSVKGVIVLSTGLPNHIAMREKEVVINHFNNAHLRIKRVDSYSQGNAVILFSKSRGVHSLGRPGKPAEEVAEDACSKMKEELKFPVDKHTADQLLIYTAFADGISRIKTSEITMHTKTNAWVIEKFVDRRFFFKGNIIECR